MDPKIDFSVDKTKVAVGDIVEIMWKCYDDEGSTELTIDNGFRQLTESVGSFGCKRIRINRASARKVQITLGTVINGQKCSRSISVDVRNKRKSAAGVLPAENDIIELEYNEQEEAPWWRNVIFFVATLLITIPILPVVYKLIPNLNWNGWDRLLEFFLLLCAVGAVLSIRRWFDIVAFVLMLTILTMGTIKDNGYGFRQLAQDYGVFKYERKHNSKIKTKPIIIPKTKDNKYEAYNNKIRLAADYKNPVVRNFAVQQTTEEPFSTFGSQQYSDDLMNIVHAFAVFKAINSNWKYVHDPNGFEYNSKASETIQNRSNGKFTGDCDDHAILMAACVQAVGAKARIVLSSDHEICHAYPELYLGSYNNTITAFYFIEKLFPEYRGSQEFHYYKDDNGDYWLNLDYTEPYPGGRFLQDSIMSIIYL